MRVDFPYKELGCVEIPEKNLRGIFGCPDAEPPANLDALLDRAFTSPIGSPPLRDLAAGEGRALIVSDDISRPTPVHAIVPYVLRELQAAGLEETAIEFMMALGTHRFMTPEEIAAKLGTETASRYRVFNHDWKDNRACQFIGETSEGVEVWVNRKVTEADLVIGIGRIMPIDVCGFTGGGKILIPGLCGQITNSEMHWVRAKVPDEEVIGRRDNPIRRWIDSTARKAGLHFIVNVIMDGRQRVVGVVAGDLEEAHRKGCETARLVHEVRLPANSDIVIADGYPFDIEFWQVNKALDTAGLAVRPGGVVIIVSPCYEGLSSTNPEILEFGYRKVHEIIELVESGRICDKAVGIHMIQVSKVAMEKATVILVTAGIPQRDVERVGLLYASTPARALDMAFARVGKHASVTVLRNSAEMLARFT